MPSALKCPELLAPAGYWDCAKAAVENGADAIYFGLDRFNARMRAQNFTEADLPELMAFLHRRGVKGYVTLNTLIFPSELAEAEQYLRSMIAAGVDAAIVQDIGICRLIRHLSPDFPIHASTQMTITSAAGVKFAQALGCQLVVLARECSIKEINKIQQAVELPLEVFVHGALCVAYSGQCLTSEALGGRSANRGECAQACRMPYDLVVDGKLLDLGDRKYLLSPQDLAGLEVLPELVKAGVTCLKIEGRLKTPEYVANVTQVYRKALDRIMANLEHTVLSEEQYNLEMAFSRGLYTGWFEGINNQELVHARFGKKRGFYLGEVTEIRNEKVTVQVQEFPKAGDGVVFDSGHPEAKEEGGRIYTVEQRGQNAVLSFGRDALNFRKIEVGNKVWKTSDPELDRHLRQSFNTEIPQFQRSIQLEIHGEIGQNLVAIARDEQGNITQVESTMPLVEAHNKHLTSERLEEQLGRLGNTPFYLEKLTNHITGKVMIPVSELNRLRREIVNGLEELRSRPKQWQLNPNASRLTLYPQIAENLSGRALRDIRKGSHYPSLVPLVRTFEQLKAVVESDISTVYCEFEDPRTYRDAVTLAHSHHQQIWVAPPRITKPGENWILQQVRDSEADGYLVRNYDQLQFFAGDPCGNGKAARCLGDFSLNVANGLTADYLKQHFNLERLTASYDLNIDQLKDLITSCPADWFEITIHQHMPMFHMEHCVFCAFMSQGTDYTNCGRPCEQHEVKLLDRTGKQHVLKADAGCRNTVFNATAQTGAEYVSQLQNLGVHHFRVEFVDESPEQVIQTLHYYRQLLQGEISGSQLWRALKVQNQLGVTRGTASR
ncbi:MAG: U32 family peptidase [Timaviella obliquedivisa GSE-PSE-MK23-08B]|jgi:putative protease|nr:U32 family peptidase [Timaviella obliquedivisa GSE-PSE-MK23-08B]